MKSGVSQAGFTLVEVTLAILVVALGLLSVFSLFPSGLRASDDSVADTRAGLFAETVFGKMRGGAEELVLWSQWNSPAMFISKTLITRDSSRTFETDLVTDDIQTVDFPPKSGQKLRYRLTIDTTDTLRYPTDTLRYPTKLEVCDGQYGPFLYQSVFYTEFVFKGM